jgi:hypothetical protein
MKAVPARGLAVHVSIETNGTVLRSTLFDVGLSSDPRESGKLEIFKAFIFLFQEYWI